jgi:hypothetical protein
MRSTACFSRTYEEARSRFCTAAEEADAALTSFPHPTRRGADDEDLAIDVAWLGDPQAERFVLVTSGIHGIEGFCGSGAQTAILVDTAIAHGCREAGIALMLVHAVNPFGFSHWRRVNEDNVDLNRNFMDFTKALPHNVHYDEVAGLLLPAHWPPSELDEGALMSMVALKGLDWYQAALTAGQYHDPHGLFFGGQKASWSNYTLRRILARFGAGRKAMRWIDLHTGLGPWGYGEPICMGANDADQTERTRQIWGSHVTSIHDGSSSSSSTLTGLSWRAVPETLPSLDYAGIALEFGTLPRAEVLDALRGDHWLHRHPEADNGQRALIRQAMWSAFYGDADDWRDEVVDQAGAAVRAAYVSLR